MTEKEAAPLIQLVADCRGRMEHDLCELFDELGPTLIQAAIAGGNGSREHERRVAFSTVKLALQSHWDKVTAALKTKLATRATQARKTSMESVDLASLTLLSEGEQSVQLAVRELLERLTSACRDETSPLQRRISYLVLRTAMQPGDTTFSMPALWACIEAACREIECDTNIRILLLQMVGEQMAIELPQLYRVVNEALIEADILPRLKSSYRNAPVDAHEVAEESATLTSALGRLVTARTQVSGAGSGSGTGEASREATASDDLFKSLKTLEAAPKPDTPGAHTNVVRIARDSGAARHVKPVEAVTLDIVAELFDLIFSDENVAEGIKVLVARLQTTVLRAAMLNQRFFADRSHPARRFLDSISIVAVRWGKVVNGDDPFYLKLAELVDRVQCSYNGDMTVFDVANADLEAFLTEREELEEQQSRALAEAVQAKEEEIRLRREAEVRCQAAANTAIIRAVLPEAPAEIEEFLRTYWRDVLQGRISQYGEEGEPTLKALRIAADLQQSVIPRHLAKGPQSQVGSLPDLLSEINVGFEEIGTDPGERKAFLDMLIDLQLAALRPPKKKKSASSKKEAEAPRPRVRGAGPTLQVSHATHTGVRIQDISLPKNHNLDADSKPDRTDLRKVRQLVRGDWVDFITGGQSRREHLKWINSSRTLMLFSNSASVCAISITPEALAVRVKNGTARIVQPDRPMFERAIHTAIKSLERLA